MNYQPSYDPYVQQDPYAQQGQYPQLTQYDMPIRQAPMTYQSPMQQQPMMYPTPMMQPDLMMYPSMQFVNQEVPIQQVQNNTEPSVVSGIMGLIGKQILGYFIFAIFIVGVILLFYFFVVKPILANGYKYVKEKICNAIGPVLEITGSDYCDAGPGNVIDPLTTNANYIYQTIDENNKVISYEVPGDGSVWYIPASHHIKSEGVEVLDYAGGSINSSDNPAYHGIEFKNNSETIFANSVNENAHNAYGDRGRAVYELQPPHAEFVKEPLFLYRKQVGQDLVYAVFRRASFVPPPGPEYIFATYNDEGGIGYYAVPESNMWTDAAYLGLKTGNVNQLEYAEDYNGNLAVGIQYHNNDESIFRYSENDNQYNSFNTGDKNNGQSVIAMSAPIGYTREYYYLYRAKDGGDYIYAVFRRNDVIPPPMNYNRRTMTNIGEINSGFEYVYATVNEFGVAKYYQIVESILWYEPAIFFVKGRGVKEVRRDQGFLGFPMNLMGILFENNNNTIFKYSNNENGDNAYGIGGRNTINAVKNIKAPEGFYAEPLYLIRDQSGANYIYKVFRRAGYKPAHTDEVPNPNGGLMLSTSIGEFKCRSTCDNGDCTDLNRMKYVLRCFQDNTNIINNYPIRDSRFWETPGDNITIERDHWVNGRPAILFKNNSDAERYIFNCSTNNDRDNSYNEMDRLKIYSMVAPIGWSKETKYAVREQAGRRYVYAVFRRNGT